MAPGVLSRRSCEVSSFESDEIPHPHGHQEGQDGSRWMGPRKTTGHGLQTSGRRRTVLARTSSWAPLASIAAGSKGPSKTPAEQQPWWEGSFNRVWKPRHRRRLHHRPRAHRSSEGRQVRRELLQKGRSWGNSAPRTGARRERGKPKIRQSNYMLWLEQWKRTLCIVIAGAKLCFKDTPGPCRGWRHRPSTCRHFGRVLWQEGFHFLSSLCRSESQWSSIGSCSVEKSSGTGDLLQDEPYSTHLGWAHNGYIDAYHSGFPRTTFSKLRFTPADGIATTCTHHGRALRKEGKHGAWTFNRSGKSGGREKGRSQSEGQRHAGEPSAVFPRRASKRMGAAGDGGLLDTWCNQLRNVQHVQLRAWHSSTWEELHVRRRPRPDSG